MLPRRRHPVASALALAIFASVPGLPTGARAQDVPQAPTIPAPPAAPAPKAKLWRGAVLANASLLFGNNQQQVLGADGKLARVDSSLALSAELQTQYGEAAVDTAPRVVTKRLWLATVTANYKPLAVISGFLTTTYESNLEKRIASRYSLGAGAKWNILQSPATHASLSLSLSGEHTVARDSTVHFPDKKLARLAWLGRFHHSFDDRMELTHATSWQPSASGPFQFLVATSTELRYKMNGSVSLSLAFTDNYDSGALSRGARTYNDGQMLFGVAAGW
jgi:Protein of unknown function, DUF481